MREHTTNNVRLVVTMYIKKIYSKNNVAIKCSGPEAFCYSAYFKITKWLI